MQSLTFPSSSNPWLIRLLTFLLAALAAGSAMFWILKWPTPAGTVRAAVVDSAAPAIDSERMARLLGASARTDATSAPVNLSAKFKLLGVIAQGGSGSALIALEGTPPKPYRVGDTLSDGLVLQTVKARSVVLGPAGQPGGSFTLELPWLPGMTPAH